MSGDPAACPVVILCGGRGVRLREKTVAMPKPLLGIGPRPIVWHVMKLFERHGFRHFVLCLGYKGELVERYFRKLLAQPAYREWRVTFARTGLDTPTGGRLRRVLGHLDGEQVMVTYADGLADLDLGKLLAYHRRHGRMGTVTATRPRSPFGEMKLTAAGVVDRFDEKPIMKSWINGGFFVFDRAFVSRVGRRDVLEQAPLVELARERELVAFRHEGFWKCMDTYKDLLEMNDLWRRGRAPWKSW